MRLVVVMLAVMTACKSQGTITLDFELAAGVGSACAGVTQDGSAYYELYAEPQTSCDVCACGGCFGARSDEVVACRGCASVSGAAVSLRPGPWAVVLELWGGDGRLIASECIDAIVDSDGTASSTLPGTGIACANATCPGS